jgi:hypothetical protein
MWLADCMLSLVLLLMRWARAALQDTFIRRLHPFKVEITMPVEGDSSERLLKWLKHFGSDWAIIESENKDGKMVNLAKKQMTMVVRFRHSANATFCKLVWSGDASTLDSN